MCCWARSLASANHSAVEWYPWEIQHGSHWRSCTAFTPVFSEIRDKAVCFKGSTVDSSLLKDPNLYPRFKFALPWENKESFPLRGRVLLKTYISSTAGQSCLYSIPSCPALSLKCFFHPVPSRKECCPMIARKKVNTSLLDLLPGPFPTMVMVGLMLQTLP